MKSDGLDRSILRQPKTHAENRASRLSLSRLANDLADALFQVDVSGAAHKAYQPGIGPFGEAEAVKAVLLWLKQNKPDVYGDAVIKRKPDLLIPGEWQIEFKLVRPFGDNGKEAEDWSQNVLHPYAGNTSSLGDCLKLLQSALPERKAVIVFGYEHSPSRIPLETCIKGFELLAETLLNIILSPRIELLRSGLRHPVHQVLRVYAWEVKSLRETHERSF